MSALRGEPTLQGLIAQARCGSAISRTPRRGKDSSTWPLSSMSSLGASWAGGAVIRCARTSCRSAGAGPVCPLARRKGSSDLALRSGAQYVSIRYVERLAEAGIEPPVGSKGDSCDNGPGRDPQRNPHGRGEPPTKLDDSRSRRAGSHRMSRLVQPSSSDGYAGLDLVC